MEIRNLKSLNSSSVGPCLNLVSYKFRLKDEAMKVIPKGKKFGILLQLSVANSALPSELNAVQLSE
jgi:hypothetical protein